MSWKKEYESVTQFIAAHPGIVISPSEISIPQEFRDEFYRLFDQTRIAVVDDRFPTLAVDVKSLRDNYVRIEKEIIDILKLESVVMPKDLFSFLHEPREGLMRAIYNRLFELVQQKLTLEEFEERCTDDLEAAAGELFRLGYEWWAALSLIKLLEPDKAYQVELDPEDYKPFLTELKSISFGRQAHHPTIRVPEFVVHSRRLDRYVAVKMALAREVEGYCVKIKPPVRPKKRTGDTSFVLDSRVMFLSFMETARNIPIIADIFECTLTSPDWIIEYVTKGEAQDHEVMAQVRQRVESLKPRMGAFVIVMSDDPEPLEMADLGNIRPVSVGFDQARIQPIIDTLMA